MYVKNHTKITLFGDSLSDVRRATKTLFDVEYNNNQKTVTGYIKRSTYKVKPQISYSICGKMFYEYKRLEAGVIFI